MCLTLDYTSDQICGHQFLVINIYEQVAFFKKKQKNRGCICSQKTINILSKTPIGKMESAQTKQTYAQEIKGKIQPLTQRSYH